MARGAFKTQNIMHTAGIYSDMTVDGPEIGTLVVIVDRAKNLPNRRTMTKQDPYCAIRLGKEAKKTETDKRGGQTPRWDQELRFTVHDSPDYYNLKLSVFNDDKKTELIGETFIQLTDVVTPGGGQSDTWHPLTCRGKYAGEVRMEMTYYDSRPKEEEQRVVVPAEDIQVPSVPTTRASPIKRRPLPTDPMGATPPPKATVPRSSRQHHSRAERHTPRRSAEPLYAEPEAYAPDPYQQIGRQQSLPYEHDEAPRGPAPPVHEQLADIDLGPPKHSRHRSRPSEHSGHAYREAPQHSHSAPLLAQVPHEEMQHSPNPHHSPSPAYATDPQYIPYSPQAEALVRHDPQQFDSSRRHSGFDPHHYAEHHEHAAHMQPTVEDEMMDLPPPPPVHREPIHSRTYPAMAPQPLNIARRSSYDPLQDPAYSPGYAPQPQALRSRASSGDALVRPAVMDDPYASPGYAQPPPSVAEYYPSQGYGQPPQQPGPEKLVAYAPDDRPIYAPVPMSIVPRRPIGDRTSLYRDEPSSSPAESPYHTPTRGRHSQAPSTQHTPHHPTPPSHRSSYQQSYQGTPAYATPPAKPHPLSQTAGAPGYYDAPLKPAPASPSPAPSPDSRARLPRKSVSPRPPTAEERRPSDAAPFDPDAFDVYNPAAKRSTASLVSDRGSGTPDRDPAEPIIDFHGKVIDPSDRLPETVWAPEPEPKGAARDKPARERERLTGARELGARSPRDRFSLSSTSVSASPAPSPLTIATKAQIAAQDASPGSRNRLQKRAPGQRHSVAGVPVAGAPLRDIPNPPAFSGRGSFGQGGSPGGGYGRAPPIPAKVPLSREDLATGPGGEDVSALSAEMMRIDLGPAPSTAGSSAERRVGGRRLLGYRS
ncbi:hypothetical protein EJ06DRAFT_511475 [Trichodelitschia bisporula]|uniref:C2 domain-containing protein n=1 Tax=Trichodelitschia bisporula TaxID=703511 RepID=A0A6G1HUG0_9PEZI|nr:hypothetical protein EJ06DRAFT_511475 [Trichodelitschia bisporula]